MKILLKVVAAIVVCVILVLVVLSITGLDAKARRAGLWLKGDVANFPSDWTFADQYQTIMVETHPWYLIPHTVNIFFVTYKGDLYLHADYDPGGKFPSGKSWTAAIARNPSVRLKLGNQVYDCKAMAVTDQAESDALFEVTRKKYPKSPFSNYRRRPDVYYFHVLPG
jgi:hypothetical protein